MNGVIALNTINLLADISRQFFKDKKIYKYKAILYSQIKSFVVKYIGL